ncbi:MULTISPECIES: LPS-assembly protein LptD [unclassified Moraxella]|uniref:LPS-assembly protein LptD n=1 Tax=unclassified Moraxella TaxID=2685852 RepID=UPI003AF66612
MSHAIRHHATIMTTTMTKKTTSLPNLSPLTQALQQGYHCLSHAHSPKKLSKKRMGRKGRKMLGLGVVGVLELCLSQTGFAQSLQSFDNTQTAQSLDNTQLAQKEAEALADTTTTLDITKQGTTPIPSPIISEESARTRPNYTPTAKQQASLERLKTHYQKNTEATDNTKTNHSTSTANTPLSAPMCQGQWVYPSSDYQQKNAIEASKTDKPNSAFPLYAEADYGYYDSENYAELSGNVKVNQGRQQIEADKVVVNLQEGVAAAQGNVMLVDASQSEGLNTTGSANTANPKNSKGGLITIADEIAYQTDTTKATAKDVAFASVPLQAHGYAKQLNKVDESRYEIDDVMFTTCEPEHPMWQINAKNIDIDTDTGRGEAYNATLKIKNTPVFYLPYFNFPIDDRRTSGFLLPRAGFKSDGGFNIEVPYYFNLAPNYDATLTPSIYTNRNPMLTGEFRYLTKDYGYGDLTASYLPSDRQYHDQDRSRVFFNHHWQSADYPTLSADAIYQYVSDSAYFDDFDDLGMMASQLNLPRRIQANYYNDYLTALAKVETFQTLDNNLTNGILADKDKPYYRLPQLSVNYRIPTESLPWEMPTALQKMQLTGVSDFAYFKRPITDNSAPERSGARLYNKLTASYAIERPWGYITPSASLQHLYTQYDEDSLVANGIDEGNKNKSIFVPEFSLDSGLNFYKKGSPLGKFDQTLGGYQLISPRLKYVYSPYRDQSDVPNFNTRLASLNFPQLYENSWYLGYDRLPDNHHITPSINYRYIDNNGLTRFDGSIGQQFFLDDIRVRLDNSNQPISIDSSGTVVQLSTQPRQDFWMDFDGALSDNGELNYYNAQLRYAPTHNSLYNVGVIKRNANPLGQRDLSAVTVSAVFPINDNWQFLGAVQYDNLQNRYSEILAGLTYESCCYGLSVYGRSYYNELDSTAKRNNAIMAELSLSGIASRRSGKLSRLISDRVLGYDPNFNPTGKF